MDYETSQTMHVNITYGWRVVEAMAGGPSYNATVKSDDIIVGMNGTRIRNGDELTSYLEERTIPGQTVILSIVRGTQPLNISVILGKRPALP
jgi:S1-C subfamily serine protease